MRKSLTIQCPPMGVKNTGSWWQVTADRRTDELACQGWIGEKERPLSIVFPPCRVSWVRLGHWVVDPVVAKGTLATGEYLQISYPAEPIHRDGLNMVAQPVMSIDEESYVMGKDGRRLQVRSQLPLAKGVPVGLGMRQFMVEAVSLPGTIELE